MARLKYFVKSAVGLVDRRRQRCLNCGGIGKVVARKYGVTALRRCCSCALLYRTPTDDPVEAERFYNEEYAQGRTTALPSLTQLDAMKADGFAAMENDYGAFARLLLDLGAPHGGRVFDYGCSWGYGSYLLGQAGFSVKSYEVSQSRREFGATHLGIDLAGDFEAFVSSHRGTFDVFFSSHVLEHVPSPSAVIAAGMDLLRPGGLLVSLFPNGTEAYRTRSPAAWRQLWGEVHPNFLDDRYLARTFAGNIWALASWPLIDRDTVRDWLRGDEPGLLRANACDEYELLVAARKSA